MNHRLQVTGSQWKKPASNAGLRAFRHPKMGLGLHWGSICRKLLKSLNNCWDMARRVSIFPESKRGLSMPTTRPRILRPRIGAKTSLPMLAVALEWSDAEGQRVRLFYASRADAERARNALLERRDLKHPHNSVGSPSHV